MLVRLSNVPEAELAGYELPPAHKKRRRASVGPGSCFRLEALPPTASNASSGSSTPPTFTLAGQVMSRLPHDAGACYQCQGLP